MTNAQHTPGWAGEIIIFENAYIGCWEYAFHPSRDWLNRNRAAHPECMFTPCDTEAEAEKEGREMAQHIGASFITNAEWKAQRAAIAKAKGGAA